MRWLEGHPVSVTLWTGLNMCPSQRYHCPELFKNYEILGVLSGTTLLFFIACHSSSFTPWREPAWCKGIWSSWVVSHFGSTVSWNLFLSCASQTWLDSHGVSFSQWPFRGREFNICKALWGHWGKKSLCSLEEFPGELLGTWETRQRLLPGWERVCASKCAHTHTQCRVQSGEGMGPTGKALVMWVPRLGAQNVGN